MEKSFFTEKDCFTEKDRPLPRLAVPAGAEFPVECLDFARGIRVGNLKPRERITRILKEALESGFRQPFTTVRWGRGVHWLWIGFLPKADRLAKPVSSGVYYGCAKFFISLEPEDKVFKAGMQVERGYLQAPREYPKCRLRDDWDWHRLLKQLKRGSELEEMLLALVREDGFKITAGSWEEGIQELSARDFKGALQLRRILSAAPKDHWCGCQVSYPFRKKEVQAMSGFEMVEAILAVFSEVSPVMRRCLQVPLLP